MKTTCTAALIAVSTLSPLLHADHPIFSVSAFIAGIEGDGFVGDADTEVGATWEFPWWQDGSYYVYSVDDTPFEFNELASSALGGDSYGGGRCVTEVTDSTVFVSATTDAFVNGGDTFEFADAYTQVHGEFHLQIDAPASIEYDFCNETNQSTAWGQIYLRKLVGGTFQTMVELVTLSDAGSDCTQGTLEVEPGVYQLYFSSYLVVNNNMPIADSWDFASSDLEATLTITSLAGPILGDVTGDGHVDGADLAGLLSEWGSTANARSDLNGDGIVDGADLALLLAAWG